MMDINTFNNILPRFEIGSLVRACNDGDLESVKALLNTLKETNSLTIHNINDYTYEHGKTSLMAAARGNGTGGKKYEDIIRLLWNAYKSTGVTTDTLLNEVLLNKDQRHGWIVLMHSAKCGDENNLNLVFSLYNEVTRLSGLYHEIDLVNVDHKVKPIIMQTLFQGGTAISNYGSRRAGKRLRLPPDRLTLTGDSDKGKTKKSKTSSSKRSKRSEQSTTAPARKSNFLASHLDDNNNNNNNGIIIKEECIDTETASKVDKTIYDDETKNSNEDNTVSYSSNSDSNSDSSSLPDTMEESSTFKCTKNDAPDEEIPVNQMHEQPHNNDVLGGRTKGKKHPGNQLYCKLISEFYAHSYKDDQTHFKVLEKIKSQKPPGRFWNPTNTSILSEREALRKIRLSLLNRRKAIENKNNNEKAKSFEKERKKKDNDDEISVVNLLTDEESDDNGKKIVKDCPRKNQTATTIITVGDKKAKKKNRSSSIKKQETKFCIFCGQKLLMVAKFCAICGKEQGEILK